MGEIHDEVAKSIGHLVMSFNELELAAGDAIMRLLKQEKRVGGVFAAIPSFSEKLSILRALEFKIVSEPLRRQFDDLLETGKKINEHRNRLIHAQYVTVVDADDVDSIITSRLRDTHKFELADRNSRYFSSVNTDEVMDLADDAAVLAFKLLEISAQFNPGGD
jgi:hypothetical protein